MGGYEGPILYYGHRGFLADFFIEYLVTALHPIGRKNAILSVLVRILVTKIQ